LGPGGGPKPPPGGGGGGGFPPPCWVVFTTKAQKPPGGFSFFGQTPHPPGGNWPGAGAPPLFPPFFRSTFGAGFSPLIDGGAYGETHWTGHPFAGVFPPGGPRFRPFFLHGIPYSLVGHPPPPLWSTFRVGGGDNDNPRGTGRFFCVHDTEAPPGGGHTGRALRREIFGFCFSPPPRAGGGVRGMGAPRGYFARG